MKTKHSRQEWEVVLLVCFALAIVVFLSIRLPSVVSWGPGPNYRNYSVKTMVNVTDSMPEIINITCNGEQAITLVAGSTYTVNCLVQIRDFNGGITINGSNGSNVNGTFYYHLNRSSDSNDNNVHYSNATCNLNGTPSGFFVNWTCGFDVWYYANNGSWIGNFTVLDTYHGKNYTANGTDTSYINALYALNVTSIINYGDLAVSETSAAIPANVTNFGNMNINVSVYGFGGEDFALYSTLAMICDQRNISIASERYALTAAAYGSMTSVTASPVLLPGLTVPQQTDDAALVVNSTYWRLYVNESDNPYGQCNGTVIFSAELP